MNYSMHLSNGLPIKTWINDTNDQELFNIYNILEKLSNVEDVRKYISQIVKNNQIIYDDCNKIFLYSNLKTITFENQDSLEQKKNLIDKVSKKEKNSSLNLNKSLVEYSYRNNEKVNNYFNITKLSFNCGSYLNNDSQTFLPSSISKDFSNNSISYSATKEDALNLSTDYNNTPNTDLNTINTLNFQNTNVSNINSNTNNNFQNNYFENNIEGKNINENKINPNNSKNYDFYEIPKTRNIESKNENPYQKFLKPSIKKDIKSDKYRVGNKIWELQNYVKNYTKISELIQQKFNDSNITEKNENTKEEFSLNFKKNNSIISNSKVVSNKNISRFVDMDATLNSSNPFFQNKEKKKFDTINWLNKKRIGEILKNSNDYHFEAKI